MISTTLQLIQQKLTKVLIFFSSNDVNYSGKAKATSSAEETFKVNFKGVAQRFRVVKVPGDGDWWYHALGIEMPGCNKNNEREWGANLLLKNLQNPVVRVLIGQEIEDNFMALALYKKKERSLRDLFI